eukprot:TRINITY_DN2750_c0_g1_i1.p1 TRINITY_DN2750_c0_g1~~TRINITY_DN2750_c0_g1_i1.p1  ORF type:complete len:151 (+),score=33.57 TRINITY_DN2750_c0_g1_i1:184-636(+)
MTQKGGDEMTLTQILRGLDIQEMCKDEEQKKILIKFFNSFLIDQGNPDTYNVHHILTVLYILSGSKKNEKAEALFELFDVDSNGVLEDEQIKEVVISTLTAVHQYSENMLDLPDDVKKDHTKYFNKKVQELVPHLISCLLYTSPSPRDQA